MSFVLSQFMSPLAIVRFQFIVAATVTIFAFALVALVVVAGGREVLTGLLFG